MNFIGEHLPDPVASIAGFVLLFCELDCRCLVKIVWDQSHCPQARLAARVVYWAIN